MNIKTTDIIIVIPIYKAHLTEEEYISINQCIRVLHNYTIRFVGPVSIEHIEGFENIPIEHFDNEYFQSINSYNHLMMEKEFYIRFAKYKYILIHQTDSFIFRDELLQWAQAGFSYIGAPWLLKSKYRTIWGRIILQIRGISYAIRKHPFRPLLLGDKVGNGGLSLRNVQDFIRKCDEEPDTIQYYLFNSQKYSEFNEDAYWATRFDFRYPTLQEALQFAFDIHPQECLKQTNRNLPFGCHGWTKKENKTFWEPIIQRQTGSIPLRVYFDYQAFTHQSFGGVSRYFAEIINRLPHYNISPILGIQYSNNAHLQTVYKDILPEIDIHQEFIPKWKNKHLKTLLFKCLSHMSVSHFPYPKYANRHHCSKQIQESQFDMLHATYFDTYVLNANRSNKPLVITIHDMIDEVMHDGHSTPRRKAILAKQSTHIIAVSNHTKKDIMQLLHTEEDKISVVYHGCSIMPTTPAETPILPTRYILYVGGRERTYKNFRMFLQAMSIVLSSEKIKIVCVGTPFTPEEKDYIQKLNLQKDISTIYAKEDQLYYIYSHALCFVYPSCYEGFGLPILEAWSAKCPIILSNSSCFPEIAGDAALYFNQNDVSDLSGKILQLLQSPNLNQELIRRGEIQLEQYSWENAAKQTAHIYHNLYTKHV